MAKYPHAIHDPYIPVLIYLLYGHRQGRVCCEPPFTAEYVTVSKWGRHGTMTGLLGSR